MKYGFRRQNRLTEKSYEYLREMGQPISAREGVTCSEVIDLIRREYGLHVSINLSYKCDDTVWSYWIYDIENASRWKTCRERYPTFDEAQCAGTESALRWICDDDRDRRLQKEMEERRRAGELVTREAAEKACMKILDSIIVGSCRGGVMNYGEMVELFNAKLDEFSKED